MTHTRVGIVGTGFIARAMVKGLMRSAPTDLTILLSPRNAEIAEGLTQRYSETGTTAPASAGIINAKARTIGARCTRDPFSARPPPSDQG